MTTLLLSKQRKEKVTFAAGVKFLLRITGLSRLPVENLSNMKREKIREFFNVFYTTIVLYGFLYDRYLLFRIAIVPHNPFPPAIKANPSSLTFNSEKAMTHVKQLTKPLALVLILAMTSFTWGCTTTTGAGRGAGIGAASGAVIGGIIGSQTGSWGKGALLGAVIGGAAGALIGDYMDAQAEEIDNQVDGATVERVGEGIRVVFDTGLLFTTGSSTLTSTSRYNIQKLANILNKYYDTDLVIEGHTDSQGSEYSNQVLSEKRAESVASLLRAYGVSGSRISTVGFGETRPVASNETAAGRRLNRRVEVLIYANDSLKNQAETGELRM